MDDKIIGYAIGYADALAAVLKLPIRTNPLDSERDKRKFREGVAALKSKIKKELIK